jgi:hypothetical protein
VHDCAGIGITITLGKGSRDERRDLYSGEIADGEMDSF